MSETLVPSGMIDSKATTGATRRRRWLVALFVVAVAAIVADGAWQKPADPVEPLTLQGQERVGTLDSAALRIATFNIHAGVGRDGIRDLGRTAAAPAESRRRRLTGGPQPVLGFPRSPGRDCRGQIEHGLALRASRETLVA